LSTTSLSRLVEDYLADARARGLSPKTLQSGYGFILQRVLLPWCERQGIVESTQLDNRVLNRFTSEMLETGGRRGRLSRHTVDTYVRNVNLFLRWCRQEGEIGDLRAQTPRLPQRVLEVVSRDEVDRLENVATKERDKVIVRLLADTGIRASELVGLRPEDLLERGRDRFIRVHGKGAKERLVPVHPHLHRRLLRLGRGRPADAAGDWLFIALRRSPGRGHDRLTISGLDQLVSGLGQRAGLGKRVYPHLLRHSFATEMLNAGMDAITLSRILGHSSLVMIQRTYAHQTVADLSEALLKALDRAGQ
jgi:integrase/recombinase XerD